jgi:hypothetical protein
MKKLFLTACFLITFVLGLWHLKIALRAIFLFSNNEPLTSWIAILFGPCLTLIIGIIMIFAKKTGAYSLIAAGLISGVAFFIGEHGVTDNLSAFLWQISAPMLLLGVATILLSNRAWGSLSGEKGEKAPTN